MPTPEEWQKPETKATRWMRFAYRMGKIAVLTFAGLWFVYAMLKDDSRSSRAATARRCQELKNRIQADPEDEEAFQELVAITRYWSSFKRCYALGTIGELGPIGVKAMPVFKKAMRVGTGFERYAAARALSNLGPLSSPALDELLCIVVKHSNEGSALFAAEAIEKIGDTSPKVIDALTKAINQPDCYERKKIEQIRDRLVP